MVVAAGVEPDAAEARRSLVNQQSRGEHTLSTIHSPSSPPLAATTRATCSTPWATTNSPTAPSWTPWATPSSAGRWGPLRCSAPAAGATPRGGAVLRGCSVAIGQEASTGSFHGPRVASPVPDCLLCSLHCKASCNLTVPPLPLPLLLPFPQRLLIDGFRALWMGNPNMNSLVGVGSTASFLVGAASFLVPSLGLDTGFLEEPVMLLAFVLLGGCFCHQRNVGVCVCVRVCVGGGVYVCSAAGCVVWGLDTGLLQEPVMLLAFVLLGVFKGGQVMRCYWVRVSWWCGRVHARVHASWGTKIWLPRSALPPSTAGCTLRLISASTHIPPLQAARSSRGPRSRPPQTLAQPTPAPSHLYTPLTPLL